MDRTGKFGRAPRTAPSLTSTLIAIAREYQQQRDSNIMDAWQKGGTFEGKKVTDAMVLQHWRERAAGVSPDDPLHDTYMNAVTNLDYTIHESKMTADYALGKKSDSQMVSFYLGWSKKIPKDSEFYRVLQRDAGQYMRSQRNMSQAKINAAKEQKYQDQQAATSKTFEAAGQFLTDTLRRLNQSGYADGNLSPTINAPDASSGSGGQDLTSFDPSDPSVSMKLMALIAPFDAPAPAEVAPGVFEPTGAHGSYQPNKNVLYHSDTIDPKTGQPKPVTGADIIAQLTKFDPSYKPGQPVDVAYLTGLLDRQNQGIQERIDRATKTGHMQDAAQAEKDKGYIAALTRQVSAWPVERAYMDLNTTWMKAFNDPTISPQALKSAWQAYQTGLYGLAKDSRIAANDNMRARLVAEANGKTDTPTLGESFTGEDVNMDGYVSKASTDAQGALKLATDQIDAVTRSAALPDTDPTKTVWTYGTTDQHGVFTPDPNGTEIGAATVAAVNAGGAMPQTVTIDDPRGGAGIKMTVTAVPVYGKATDPVTGKDIPVANAQPIAYAYNFPQGGKNTLQYGWLTKDPSDPNKSTMVFSHEENPPWSDKLPVTPSSSGGNHFVVDFSSMLPTAVADSGAPGSPALNTDATKGGIDLSKEGAVAGLPGFHVADVPKPSAANPHPTGNLVFDPYAAARATDTSRGGLGGTDPVTDFHSLTVANLMSSSDGRAIMSNLDQHPDFKAQVTNDGFTYAGVQTDPKTGQWLPGTGDANKLSAAAFQQNLMVNTRNLQDVVAKGAAMWQRLTTGSPFPGATTPNGSPTQGQTPLAQLATELVKGTPFESIAKGLLPGTLTPDPLRGKQQDDLANFTIKQAKAITVPTATVKNVVTHDQQQGPGGAATVPVPGVSTPPPAASTYPSQQTGTSGSGAGRGQKAL